MFLKNWYKFFAMRMGSYSEFLKFTNLKGNLVGDSTYAHPFTGGVLMNTTSPSYKCYGPDVSNATCPSAAGKYSYNCNVFFGTGDTPVTLDDFKLSGDVLAGYSATAKKTIEEISNGARVKCVYTLTNNNASAITIKEIGLCFANTNTDGEGVMVERTVLDAPVTIEPSGVGQVVYNIDINYPA